MFSSWCIFSFLFPPRMVDNDYSDFSNAELDLLPALLLEEGQRSQSDLYLLPFLAS